MATYLLKRFFSEKEEKSSKEYLKNALGHALVGGIEGVGGYHFIKDGFSKGGSNLSKVAGVGLTALAGAHLKGVTRNARAAYEKNKQEKSEIKTWPEYTEKEKNGIKYMVTKDPRTGEIINTYKQEKKRKGK